MTICADDADLLDEEDTEPNFEAHVCCECGRDVPGSPDDCEVICSRCSYYSDFI